MLRQTAEYPEGVLDVTVCKRCGEANVLDGAEIGCEECDRIVEAIIPFLLPPLDA